MNIQAFEKRLLEADIAFHKGSLLKDYTTIKVGGKASYLIEIGVMEEVPIIVDAASENNVPYYVIGQGSNLLFMDEGFDGVVIVLKAQFSSINIKGAIIEVEAGATLKDVCEFAYQHSLSGLEFAYGIPGSMGGAVFMNAGAYGFEMKDVIAEVTYFDEQGQWVSQMMNPSDFGYRFSPFSQRHVCIVKVKLNLSYGTKAIIQQKMDDYMSRRIAKQPLDYPSAGSIFKRHSQGYASAMIDQCGLKGLKIGGAMVSLKHAGFLINYQQATSQDFLDLIDQIKKEVKKQTGYDLECEVKIIKNKT